MLLTPPSVQIQDITTPIPIMQASNPCDIRVRNESSEPLVEVENGLQVFNAYNTFPALPKRDKLKLRKEFISRLLKAQDSLPQGFSLVILDGHRHISFQHELISFYGEIDTHQTGDASLYVANPENSDWIPPHTTGGAADLTLAYEGTPLTLGSDYDYFGFASHLDSFERIDAITQASQLRRLLFKTLTAQEIAPLPQEWWHWSFGDQQWAKYFGKAEALYGTVN